MERVFVLTGCGSIPAMLLEKEQAYVYHYYSKKSCRQDKLTEDCKLYSTNKQ